MRKYQGRDGESKGKKFLKKKEAEAKKFSVVACLYSLFQPAPAPPPTALNSVILLLLCPAGCQAIDAKVTANASTPLR